MNKYVIYTNVSDSPIIIECDSYGIDYNSNMLFLYKENTKVAVFNFENIVGFSCEINDPLYKIKQENALLKDHIETLEIRLKHLLQSNTIRTYDAKKDGEYIYDVTELDGFFNKYREAFHVLSACTTCNECEASKECVFSNWGQKVVYNCPHFVAKGAK